MSGGSLFSSVMKSARVPIGRYISPSPTECVSMFHVPRWGDNSLIELFDLNGNADLFPHRREESVCHQFNAVFEYLRVQRVLNYCNPHHWLGLWLRSFYVSREIQSIRLIAPDNTPVIEFFFAASAWTLPFCENLWQEALEEVTVRLPELSLLGELSLDLLAADKYATVRYHPLLYIIAEESEISFIDYGQHGLWYQTLAPAQLLGVRLVNLPS